MGNGECSSQEVIISFLENVWHGLDAFVAWMGQQKSWTVTDGYGMLQTYAILEERVSLQVWIENLSTYFHSQCLSVLVENLTIMGVIKDLLSTINIHPYEGLKPTLNFHPEACCVVPPCRVRSWEVPCTTLHCVCRLGLMPGPMSQLVKYDLIN